MKNQTKYPNLPPDDQDALVRHIIECCAPDPGEADFWAVGVFQKQPDDSYRRFFVAIGPLKDCARSVSHFLGHNRELIDGPLNIMSFQGRKVHWLMQDAIETDPRP